MISLLASTLILLSATSEFASAPGADGFACVPEGMMQERNVCAFEAYKRASNLVQREYLATRKVQLPAERTSFASKQRRWSSDRDARCEGQTKELEGGNAWAEVFYNCLASASRHRVKELREMRVLR